MKKDIYLTKEKIRSLRLESRELTAQRKQATERVKFARELGDLTENEEYLAAKRDLEGIDRRITEIEHVLSHTKTIVKPESPTTVSLGSMVTILRSDKVVRCIQIVGTIEAYPLNDKISDESPFGQSLLGKEKGDSVIVNTMSGAVAYTITDIR